jgi:hypothetical protein
VEGFNGSRFNIGVGEVEGLKKEWKKSPKFWKDDR